MLFVGAVSFVLIFRQFSSSFPLLQSMTPSHCFELDMQTPGVHSNWSFPQAARIVYIRSDRMKKLSQGLFLSFLSSQFLSWIWIDVDGTRVEKAPRRRTEKKLRRRAHKYIYINIYIYKKEAQRRTHIAMNEVLFSIDVTSSMFEVKEGIGLRNDSRSYASRPVATNFRKISYNEQTRFYTKS